MAKKEEETPQDVVDYVERFGQWVEANSKTLVGAFAVFVLAVGAYWAFSMYSTSKINSIAKESGTVNRKVDLLEKAIAEVKNKDAKEFKDNKASQISELEGLVAKLTKNFPNQAMTDLSVVRWASFLMKDSDTNIDKALTALNLVKPSGSREMSATVMFFKAQLLAKKGEMDKVKALYDEVISTKGWALFHSEALIQKGLMLESEGKSQEAIALLNKAKEKNKDSKFSKDATKFLRFLKLKASQPEMFKEG